MAGDNFDVEAEEFVMASQQRTVDFIVEQIANAGAISSRKMFGEFCIYCDGKVVALICDDQLFVKPTKAGRAHIGDAVVAPPYKGAKPCYVAGSHIRDALGPLALNVERRRDGLSRGPRVAPEPNVKGGHELANP